MILNVESIVYLGVFLFLIGVFSLFWSFIAKLIVPNRRILIIFVENYFYWFMVIILGVFLGDIIKSKVHFLFFIFLAGFVYSWYYIKVRIDYDKNK